MKELNFLPQCYVANARRKRQNRRNGLMCTGLILALVSLHILNITRIRSAEASLVSLQNGTGGWKSAQDQLRTLETKKAFYRHQIDLLNKLDDAAPVDAAIGELTQLLTDTMAIQTLLIDTKPPPNTMSTPPPGTPAPTTPPPAPAGTRAVLTGMAVNDVDVGIFLGKLSSCPLFTDVALSYSRETHHSGRLMREFEVKFVLRPVEAAP